MTFKTKSIHKTIGLANIASAQRLTIYIRCHVKPLHCTRNYLHHHLTLRRSYRFEKKPKLFPGRCFNFFVIFDVPMSTISSKSTAVYVGEPRLRRYGNFRLTTYSEKLPLPCAGAGKNNQYFCGINKQETASLTGVCQWIEGKNVSS